MAIESTLWELASGFLQDIPSKALTGDVFAVSAVLIGFYFLVLLIKALTEILIFFLKRLILLIIVSLASYQFAQYIAVKLTAEGMTNDNIFLGGLGVLGCVLAMILALSALFASVKKAEQDKEVKEEKKVESAKADGAVVAGSNAFSREEVLSADAIKKDRNLGVVVAYLIVAEFGVMSSKTVAAPNVTVGMIFFFGFMLAALFFIRQTYINYNTGIRHFLAALVIGGILSLVLGALWGGYSINQLLSTEYFITDSMVAFLTGIAVSLFMGSKG